MYLGIKAVLAITFARIHRANLINFGILPVTIDETSYSAIKSGDKILISNILEALNGTGQIRLRISQQETVLQVSLLFRKGKLLYSKQAGFSTLSNPGQVIKHDRNKDKIRPVANWPPPYRRCKDSPFRMALRKAYGWKIHSEN
jgi:hypothetical protein